MRREAIFYDEGGPGGRFEGILVYMSIPIYLNISQYIPIYPDISRTGYCEKIRPGEGFDPPCPSSGLFPLGGTRTGVVTTHAGGVHRRAERPSVPDNYPRRSLWSRMLASLMATAALLIHAVPSERVTVVEELPFTTRIALEQLRADEAAKRGGAGAQSLTLEDDATILVRHVRDRVSLPKILLPQRKPRPPHCQDAVAGPPQEAAAACT